MLGIARAVVAIVAGSCGACVLAPRCAAAQAAPAAATAAPARAEPTSGWYGWQTLTVDAAALALGAAIAASADVELEPANVVAATWYGVGAVAAPAVHHAHDNWPIGLSDFGLRALAPPVIGFFGWITACTANRDFESECAASGWGVGSLIGLSGVALIDGLVLARPRTAVDERASRTSWYGWQMLAIDLVGYGLGAATVSGKRTDEGAEIHPALGAWAIGYTVGVIGAPIVHFAHGKVGFGFLSLGLRALAAPLLGVLPGLAGYCAATGGASDCAEHGAQWGLLGGSLAVGLFDALVLAHEPADDDDAAARYAPTASIGPGAIAVSGYW